MRKIVSIVICCMFLLSVSLIPIIAINEETSKDNIAVSALEKDFETNVVEEKVYSTDFCGNESVETINSWTDIKSDSITEVDSFGVASLFSANNIATMGIIGTDDRTEISNTRKFPYSAVVHIYVEFMHGKEAFEGTGFLVADNIVVTSAHLLYKKEYDGWATSVTVKPGRNGILSMPYGLAKAKKVAVSTQWEETKDYNYDWGAIKTAHSIVGNPGKFSMTTVEDSWNIPAKIIGYPGEKEYKQYEMSDLAMTVGDYSLGYQIDTTAGQSGSPILNENNVAIGVHSRAGDGHNFGIRFTPNVLYYLNEFIEQND